MRFHMVIRMQNAAGWEKGPEWYLFRTVSYRLGHKDIIAEDLGFMTDSVKRLVEESGYPNMKVIEFAFDERDTGNASDYLPHNYTINCVVLYRNPRQ